MDGEKQINQEPGWVFNPNDGKKNTAPPAASLPPAPATMPTNGRAPSTVEWTASEFIAHRKSVGWYLALLCGALVLAALTYLLTKDKISTGVILFAAFVFGVAANRQPRVLAYRLDEGGLTIGQKMYPYTLFRSFTIVNEGPFSSVTLLPIKRFMPAYNIYFAPDDEERILDVLVYYLPYEQRQESLFDSLMHRMRF